ncbi:hypothetical protein CIHG_02544 [Coccidioides immitis H538.4]|uniref:Uncharacterized protein n=2 Tax=Coccidioides immitis TaxID=5501 RepID=A0A0J8RJB7_COCIT|nr:hypothetical protein CIRG_02877 [Coccidioides immitis RMSCC 2394]KMU84761.1 hypothetical protein CIHG_02544 [Coccidioides immitis H538.4]
MSSVCCDTLEIDGDGQRETPGRIGRDGLQGQSMMDHCKRSRSEGLSENFSSRYHRQRRWKLVIRIIRTALNDTA